MTFFAIGALRFNLLFIWLSIIHLGHGYPPIKLLGRTLGQLNIKFLIFNLHQVSLGYQPVMKR